MCSSDLHRTWAPIRDLSQDLAAELGHPVQVNAYVTPPQNQGFADHYDIHDVFVLQVHGEKRWALREPVHEAPLRDQPWADRRGGWRREPARPHTWRRRCARATASTCPAAGSTPPARSAASPCT